MSNNVPADASAANVPDMSALPTPLWRWSELCQALALKDVEGPDISNIAIDSRAVVGGELFVALAGDPGARFRAASVSTRDGHDFLRDAVRRGAAGALVSRAAVDAHDFAHLLVTDTLDGLWALGRAGRARSGARVVSVTGSSGKTTLKDMLANALAAHASRGSYNNHLGVPLTLARLPRAAATAIVEIGTNHPGEIAPLASLTAAHVAVLLNVLPAHIGNFSGIDALRAEKLAITTGLAADGVLVLPDELAAYCTWPGRRITFGIASGDVQVRSQFDDEAHDAARDDWQHVTLQHGAESWPLQVPGGGQHRALTCAAAAAVAIALAQPMGPFLARLAATNLPEGRGNRLEVAGVVVFDDSYNANPVSMRYALAALAAQPGRRRVALLGDMLELGDDEARLHATLAPACAGIDVVHCAGPRMANLFQHLPAEQRGDYFADAALPEPEAFAAALRPGDVVLIKGSNMTFWARRFVDRLVETLTKRAMASERSVHADPS